MSTIHDFEAAGLAVPRRLIDWELFQVVLDTKGFTCGKHVMGARELVRWLTRLQHEPLTTVRSIRSNGDTGVMR